MPPTRGYALPTLVIPPLVAVVSCPIVWQLAFVDRTFMRFVLGSAGGAASNLVYGDVVSLLFTMALCEIGFFTGFRLSWLLRTIASLVTLCLSFALEYALAAWLAIDGHPLGYAIAFALAFAAGYGLKLVERKDQKLEAQYYELLLRNEELEDARLQIVRQDEVERRLLAADLHDQVLNDLKLLQEKIARKRDGLEHSDADEEIDILLRQAVTQVREVMDTLYPSVLEHLGLVAATEDCLRVAAQRGGFKARFRNNSQVELMNKLGMVEQSLLFRLVQESVNNALKHSQADVVRATIETENERLKIIIADDGKGMDRALLSGDSRGMRYMRQRADLIGATISWQSGAGITGTVVEIVLDLTGRDDAASSDH